MGSVLKRSRRRKKSTGTRFDHEGREEALGGREGEASSYRKKTKLRERRGRNSLLWEEETREEVGGGGIDAGEISLERRTLNP